MTTEQHKEACKLAVQMREVEEELKAWDETRSKSDLGHKQKWNSDHLVELPCRHTPVAAFEAYRQACINALKVKMTELQEAFANV
jgi:hypothetical protein